MSFDAGLTLVHPVPSVETVYRDAFARHGVFPTEDDVTQAVHGTWRDVNAASAERHRSGAAHDRWRGEDGELGFWRRFVSAVWAGCGGAELPETLLAELVRHFADESSWGVYPDARVVLPELAAEGYRLLVISNWDASLPPLLERLELAAHFDPIVVSGAVGSSKPSGLIFEEALRLLGLPASAVAHVGDSLRDDYEGARAAGLTAFLVDRKGRQREGIESVSSLAELPERLRGLSPAGNDAPRTRSRAPSR